MEHDFGVTKQKLSAYLAIIASALEVLTDLVSKHAKMI